MTDTAAAADLLLESRLHAHPVEALTENVRPRNDAESYAIQDAQMRTLGDIGGWKVGARSPDTEPTCAPLPAALVLSSPQRFAPGRFPLQLVEAELGFTIGHDLPPRPAPYTELDLVEAIASVHATIEIIGSRFRDFRKIDGQSLLADFLNNGALVVGPGRTSNVHVDQTRAALEVYFDDRLELEIIGGNTAGDVFRLLVWLANHAMHRVGGLRKGQVVTTGSCIGMRRAPPSTQVRAVFPGIDSVEATI